MTTSTNELDFGVTTPVSDPDFDMYGGAGNDTILGRGGDGVPRARRLPEPAADRPGLLVPVVMASAGVMFAMSFQAAQGSDLRAASVTDQDSPSATHSATDSARRP